MYLLGRPAAISPAVADQVQRLGYTPVRLGGADRYDTAVAIANAISGTPRSVLLATGTNFPDAMSGGALAGSQDAPLLLADPSGLSPAENTILHAGHLNDIAIIGGPTAVSNQVLNTAADTAFGTHAWDTYTNRLAPPLR